MNSIRILIAIGCLATVVVVIFVTQRAPVPHIDSPVASLRSADPIRQFVGWEACRECHSENVGTHSETGHAHTFAATQDSEIARTLCGAQAAGGEAYGTFHYDCDAEGLMASLPDRFGERRFPLDFALGSGKHAVTFLTLLREPSSETVGIEHRMTWYRGDGRLGITPGHEPLVPGGKGGEHFGRVFRGVDLQRCIACHNTTGTLAGRELTELQGGVQCEACHGPGAQHVHAAHEERDDAVELINARWSAAEEVALCGRCHRLPEDISPQRLAAYPRSLIRFQPIGLLQSRCYLESAGALKCTTCHDPHSDVDSRTIADQIATCQTCHGRPEQTPCPVSPATDCLRCHMPAVELVRGISFHDHWIRVPPQPSDPAADREPVDHAADHAGADRAVERP